MRTHRHTAPTMAHVRCEGGRFFACSPAGDRIRSSKSRGELVRLLTREGYTVTR